MAGDVVAGGGPDAKVQENAQTRVRLLAVDEVDDALLRYAVIVSRQQGQWLLCKHNQRQTWEIPGGRREPGEAILDTARRELYEETGATGFALQPVCVYTVENGGEASYGLLCFAEVEERGALPAGFEIGRVELFDKLPNALTYPYIQPPLFQRVQAFLALRGNT